MFKVPQSDWTAAVLLLSDYISNQVNSNFLTKIQRTGFGRNNLLFNKE